MLKKTTMRQAMDNRILGLALCAFLAGCGGEPPFGGDTDDGSDSGGGSVDGGVDGGDAGGGIVRDGIPPGTAEPDSASGIFRREAASTEDVSDGNGFAQGIRYNSADDTFVVDNLPFDGADNAPYQRGTAVGSLNSFAVYEAVAQYPDTATADPINQFTHRAIYGVSRNRDASGVPETQFAIVRTGAYRDYGFGGFIYQREGDVTMPTTGQAVYTGRGAGIRDFGGSGGFEYATSNVQIAIDFEDFNAGANSSSGAVDGRLSDRRVFDRDGTEITAAVINRINEENNASLTQIPTALFQIRTGNLDANGEIVGQVASSFFDDNGNPVDYEAGNYYAVIAGDGVAGTDEIVGIVVMENTADPIADTVRDTTGFIVYRGDPAAP